MRVYKLLHKPTGLFFTPSKGYGNLSVKGKVYVNRPNVAWGECLTMTHVPQSDCDMYNKSYYDNNKVGAAIKKWLGGYPTSLYVHTKPEEWEIIEL